MAIAYRFATGRGRGSAMEAGRARRVGVAALVAAVR